MKKRSSLEDLETYKESRKVRDLSDEELRNKFHVNGSYRPLVIRAGGLTLLRTCSYSIELFNYTKEENIQEEINKQVEIQKQKREEFRSRIIEENERRRDRLTWL
mgnify:CR=1 FL=1